MKASIQLKRTQSKRKQSSLESAGRKKSKPHFKYPAQPTTFELAQIAALLADNISPSEVQDLAKKAIHLWKACERELRIHTLLALAEAGRLEIKSLGPPCPPKWPCSFDDGLRLLMPKKKTKGDRYQKMRAFLKCAIEFTAQQEAELAEGTGSKSAPVATDEATLDEIEAAFIELKQQGFRNQDEYLTWRQAFIHWLSNNEAEEASNQRSKAANTRWAKKRAEKLTSQENQGKSSAS